MNQGSVCPGPSVTPSQLIGFEPILQRTIIPDYFKRISSQPPISNPEIILQPNMRWVVVSQPLQQLESTWVYASTVSLFVYIGGAQTTSKLSVNPRSPRILVLMKVLLFLLSDVQNRLY
jgi:hypothetical protein